MKEYSRFGFNMMAYSNPCKPGLLDVSAQAMIDDEGILDESALPGSAATIPAKKGQIPWWLIIAGGYLLYKEGSGL